MRYYSIENFSNKRNVSAVWTEGNDLTEWQQDYMIGNTKITENLNLENPIFYTFTYDQNDSSELDHETIDIINQNIGTMQLYVTSGYWTTTMNGANYWYTQAVKEV